MQVRELKVPDCYAFATSVFADHRGRFTAPFQAAAFREAVGHSLDVRQVNHSESAAGVIRGIHFAQVPPGQAKYLYCTRGSIIDFVVDVRVGSPTFGEWDSVRLDAESLGAESMSALYLAEGIGHGFVALADDTVVTYLCSTGYEPSREHGFSPFDPALGLPWPEQPAAVLSEKDSAAPSLAEVRAAGLLPDYAECQAWYAQLASS